MNVQLVGQPQIDGVWPAVKGHIQRAISKCDDLTISGMYAFIRSGRGFLFVADDLSAALILGFEDQRGTEVAKIYAMGSRTKADWQTVIEDIRHFAHANGAEKVIFQGRKGWQRALGIKPKFYIYEV